MAFFSVSGTSVLSLAVSDWISSITEIACQSTVRKDFFLCPVQVGIFYFTHHLQTAVGIPESQFGITKLMTEKKTLLFFCLLFLCTWDFGTLGIGSDSLPQHYSENAEVSFNL